MNVGDEVHLVTREGALQAGATGSVAGVFRHDRGDLVLVRFGSATRLVHATSVVVAKAERPQGEEGPFAV